MNIKGLDPEANLAHICELTGQVLTGSSTELVVFPELTNSGYVKLGDKDFAKEYVRCAVRIPGPFTDRLGEVAKKHRIHLVIGLLEAHPHIPYALYNSAVLFSPAGDIVGLHRKIHIPLPERNFFHPGSKMEVFPTELGNIALQVCADGSFPELSRILSLKGAEIICTTYNMPDMPGRYFEDRIQHTAGCRAMENMNFYIACNRAGSDASGPFVGHSCIAGPYGQLLALSHSNEEEILSATLEEEMLVEARSYSPYFSYRRPELYGPLTKPC